MRYLALIYGDESVYATATADDIQREIDAYNAFSREAGEAGVLGGGEALQPTMTATTVRVRDGQMLTTDGPFAETKEQLGGYYVLQCRDLDEAIQWASRIPGANVGAVEVRPIQEFS